MSNKEIYMVLAIIVVGIVFMAAVITSGGGEGGSFGQSGTRNASSATVAIGPDISTQVIATTTGSTRPVEIRVSAAGSDVHIRCDADKSASIGGAGFLITASTTATIGGAAIPYHGACQAMSYASTTISTQTFNY